MFLQSDELVGANISFLIRKIFFCHFLNVDQKTCENEAQIFEIVSVLSSPILKNQHYFFFDNLLKLFCIAGYINTEKYIQARRGKSHITRD